LNPYLSESTELQMIRNSVSIENDYQLQEPMRVEVQFVLG
jgi:hypothetical protein